ncbi:MAG: DNA primase [Tissierellia bacterium]|nr:DNA primase [Tissierellia bacterium]
MGFIPEDQINRLKDSLDIVDVISSYVELKPSGANHKGLCPFHHEKTPSFMVSPQRNSFHCFGCGEGGDAISFIMKIENLDYIGAIKFLADKMGIILEETQYNRKDFDEKDKLYKINALTAKFYFRNMLLDKRPQNYIEKRGLNIGIVNSFFLGYAKDDNGLYKFLLDQGVDPMDMLKLGLIGKSQNDGSFYDKFRDRLIFPILNSKQKVIGFGGRTISDHKIKYLNSPESQIFIKGDNLYGVNVLQKRVNREKIILVEGYMDVIGLFNYGIDYATASLGTALTDNQARLVKRYGKKVYIAYDSDTAGIKASLRAIDIFAKIDIDPFIVQFPDSMDPDEYVKAYGIEKFNKLLVSAKTSLDFKMDLVLAKNTNKLDLSDSMIDFLCQIQGNAKREIYIQKAAKALDVSFDALLEDVERALKEKESKEKNYINNREFRPNFGYDNKQKPSYPKNPVRVISRDEMRLKLEKELISKVLINRTFYDMLDEKVQEFIKSDYLLDLYRLLEDFYSHEEAVDKNFIFSSPQFEKAGISDLVKNMDMTYKEGIEKSVSDELIDRIDTFILEERQEQIFNLLKKDLNKEEKITLIKELVDIKSRLTQ